jgi:hypothetical protein
VLFRSVLADDTAGEIGTGDSKASTIATKSANNINSFIKSVKTFIITLFEGNAPLPRLFLFIILFMIIYSVISEIFGDLWKGFGAAIISFSVTALSMIFIPEQLITAIAIQYGAMGAAILTVVPFLIMLFFTVKIKSKLLARVLWIFYSIYYLLMFFIAFWNSSDTLEELLFLAATVIGLIMFFSVGFFRDLLFKGELDSEEEKAIKDINLRKLGRKVERRDAEARLDID